VAGTAGEGVGVGEGVVAGEGCGETTGAAERALAPTTQMIKMGTSGLLRHSLMYGESVSLVVRSISSSRIVHTWKSVSLASSGK